MDYRSDIRQDIDVNKLKDIATAAAGGGSDLSDSQLQQVRNTVRLLKAVDKLHGAAIPTNQLLAKPSTDADFKAARQELESVVKEIQRQNGGGGAAGGLTLSPAGANTTGLSASNGNEVANLIRSEGKKSAQSLKDANAAAAEAKLMVRAWVLHEGKRQPVHVQNYDTLDEGVSEKTGRRQGIISQGDKTKKANTETNSLSQSRDNLSELTRPATVPAGEDPEAREAQAFLQPVAAAADEVTRNLKSAAGPANATAGNSGDGGLNLSAVIPPAIVNLADTNADRGDMVQIESTLTLVSTSKTAAVSIGRPKETTEETSHLLSSDLSTFEVGRFGLIGDFSAGIIFVNRYNSGKAGDKAADFTPAASASYIVHYRLRDSEAQKFCLPVLAGAYRFLDPGIGLSVAVLPFDGDTKVGIGGELTFFDNIIHVGYGYAVTGDNDPQYYYVGIGILETLAKVGNIAAGRDSLVPSSK